jgi:hypothetical protein
MSKYNVIAKPKEGQEYILTEMMATKLSQAKFEKLKNLNPELLGGFVFIPYSKTDFCWWGKITKCLTPTKIKRAYFDIDFCGNVTQF